ncbi:MAG: hypothetical protein INR71_14515, partial [Terriglobus roseus]|nr:hypothetical protein [Terriglobus roseus]
LPGAVEQYRSAQAAIEGNNASPAVRKSIANDLVRLQASVTPELTSATKSQLVSLQKVKGLSDAQRHETEERIKFSSNPVGNAAHVSLQQMRTYHIARPDGAKGWGTVRLQLKTSGVQAAEQSSGDSSLAAALPALRQMQFPGLVPNGSTAYLLRSAVLSCSLPKECELVLVPNGSLQTEQQQ